MDGENVKQHPHRSFYVLEKVALIIIYFPSVEYGSRGWRPSALLRLRFVTHCTAQFHKLANEQAVVLLKADKYSSEQKSDFDYSKQRRFHITDKQCHAVVNKLVYWTDSQFLNQNITQLVNYCCLSYRLSFIYQQSNM